MTRPLSVCKAGERVVVGTVTGDTARVVRLASLGVLPGAQLRVQQMRPVVIVEIDESVLAMEREIAESVWVTID